MKKIRYGLIVLSLLMSLATPAAAELSIGIGIGLPNVSIGINLPVYPELVPVPGYPVYYSPQVNANYFFYDGLYWVYQDDNWYASSWYNGPWGYVEPVIVPLFILRIPVAYYRNRPASFRGWHSNAPPRWGQHWGRDWEDRRSGWDRWERRDVPQRAPRPAYQRYYSGERYPRGEQQRSLHNRNYRYQPRDQAVRQHFNSPRRVERAPAPAPRGRQEVTPNRSHDQQDHQQRSTPQQVRPEGQRVQSQQPPVVQEERQRSHGQESRPQGRGEAQQSRKDNGQEQQRDEERGRDRNR